MIKKLLKTTILTGVLLTVSIPAFADINNGWNYNQTAKTWNYYVNDKLVKDGVISYENKIYYLDNQGNLENGWYAKNDATVYFQDGLLVTGWKQIDDKWYYFSDLGKMLTGEVNLDGTTYNLASDGHLVE